MTKIFVAEGSAAPQSYEFAGQLIGQLLADLSGMLFDGRAVFTDAGSMLRLAAEAGAARGALWLLLVHGAVDAHRQLLQDSDDDDESESAKSDEVEANLLQLLPQTRAQLPALRRHAANLRHYVAIAESAHEPCEAAITRAIVRLYQGLGGDDADLSNRGLIELRSLTIYLDATASMIETQNVTSEPVRVIRPDRFHDYFLRFNELAQKPTSIAGERAVAALSSEGRISAVITRDEHPLEIAERELREHIGANTTLQDNSLLRIKALLAFIEQLRHDPAGNTQLGNPLDDALALDSLIVAASTTPLLVGSEFRFATIAQLTGFNLRLLRQQADKARKH